jgi:hypothetical protein
MSGGRAKGRHDRACAERVRGKRARLGSGETSGAGPGAPHLLWLRDEFGVGDELGGSSLCRHACDDWRIAGRLCLPMAMP